METKKYFERIEIKGDKNKLPEKSGEYEVLFNGGFYGTAKFDKTDSIASQGVICWINKIKVYWLPIPEPQQPEQPEIESHLIKIKEFLKTLFITDKYNGENLKELIDSNQIKIDEVRKQSHNNTVVGPSDTEIKKWAKESSQGYIGDDYRKIIIENRVFGVKYALSQCKAIDLRATLIKFVKDSGFTDGDEFEIGAESFVDDYLKSPENKQ